MASFHLTPNQQFLEGDGLAREREAFAREKELLVSTNAKCALAKFALKRSFF